MNREQGDDDDLRADRGGTGDGDGAFCVRIRFADRCKQWRGTAAGARERAGRAKEAKQTHKRDKGGKNLQNNNLQGRYGPNPNRAGNIPRGIVVLCQSHIPFFLGSLQLVCGSKQYTRLYPPTNLPDQNLPYPTQFWVPASERGMRVYVISPVYYPSLTLLLY
jgi:hypothetical protein